MTWADAIKTVLWTLFTGAVLFASADTLAWRGGWIFMTEFAICGLVMTLWLARRDPGLLKERLGGVFQKGQPRGDKTFMALAIVVWYGWLILMAFDARRWGFSHMPGVLRAAGAVLIPIGYFLVWLTFRENSFAAPVVRIQQERGHHVIDTGPYSVVRHPMYAGAAIYMLGTPLLLGSWAGLALLPVILAGLGVRIFIEEGTLRKNLAGYEAYAARVRYRIIPGVW